MKPHQRKSHTRVIKTKNGTKHVHVKHSKTVFPNRRKK